MTCKQSSIDKDLISALILKEINSLSLTPSKLHLENGMVFKGSSPEWQQKDFLGEVVFTTGMTGYDLSLTDPSYAGQILVFTSPLIGNYGIPEQNTWESEKIHAAGVVICDTCIQWSHGKSTQSLLEWLHRQHVPLITGIDTRHLTKVLRHAGTMPGMISRSTHWTPTQSLPAHTASFVSIPQPISYGEGQRKIIAVDCGMKKNILRHLLKYPVEILRVPFDYDYSQEDFDGILLSNGPGDPENYQVTISILQRAMLHKKPIFGICLGAQLLSLAAGARTYKLSYGHRGHNQPCIDLNTKRCYVTSQNHGYAVCEDSLPTDWHVTFRNLNDQTVEGIAHNHLPFSAVQFHPEAAPGPTDTDWLFDHFIEPILTTKAP
jgi:carbamoyl-phosphate synthase small subunit